MGVRDWFAARRPAAETGTARIERSAEPAASFSFQAPAEVTGRMRSTAIADRVSRAEALQVPAVLRARNLIAGTLATLPHRVFDADKRSTRNRLLEQIDPDIPNTVTLAEIYEDLLFEGISWLRVTDTDWRGFPVSARHVPVGSVHVAGTPALPSQAQITADQPFPADGRVFIDGRPVPDNEIIRLDSPNPPLLVHAARAIRAALSLDQAAARYSDEPLPLGYFSPAEGVADPGTEEEIQEILDNWDRARRERSWGYIGAALQANTLQWSPDQLQLADQRQHAVLEIARSAGVDPEDLGVSTTSRTYQNAEQRRMDLLDFTLGAYISAVQDRLSMRDVLPRGQFARVSFDGFLRSDTKTRMETYEIGLRVGAYTVDEIRDLEDAPPLPSGYTPPATRSPEPGQTPVAAEAESEKGTRMNDGDTNVRSVAFTEDDSATVHFDAPESTSFRVNREKRTISGLAVPWNAVARSGFSKWRFAEGSLHWSEDGRIKLNLDHDRSQAIGRAVRLQSTSRGLDATFKVARGDEGDRALSYAEDGVLDGFSIEVDFDGEADEWSRDPQDESVRLVRGGTLRGVALTATPAFDDARVSHVAASRNYSSEGSDDMAEVKATSDKGSAEDSAHLEQFTSELDSRLGKLADGLSESLGETVAAAFQTAFERVDNRDQDSQRPVRAARFSVTREEPVYSMNGMGHSLVRDAWYAGREHDQDAKERLRKYHSQTEDMSKLVESARFANNTTNAGEVVPPGYRPDLYVPELVQGRPFVSSMSRGTLSNATPFTVPVFDSASGLTGDHTEGTNPSSGSLAFSTRTVSPVGVSGRLDLTREIVDSSNPAIDQIALQAMRESYARQTEAKAYNAMNAIQAGTITDGKSPNGAQVLIASKTAPGGSDTAFDGADLVMASRQQLAEYPFERFGAPDTMLLSRRSTTAFATAVDTTGRTLLPSIGATNTSGLGNAYRQGWSVDGLPAFPSWSITGDTLDSGTGDGDGQVFTFASSDAWAWESSLLTFRFEEKQGPANIELALFGYFATHVLRPVGVAAIRIPA